MFPKWRREMKECWEDSEPRLSVGSEMKAERKHGRTWEDPDVWTFGEQLGLVRKWVVVRCKEGEYRMWLGNRML